MNNRFHINYPFFSAWQRYNWKKDDWGIGLNKEKVDKLAETNQELIVSYYKSNQQYLIKAKKIQLYPIERIKDYDLFVYVIPKSILKPKTKLKSISDMTDDEIIKTAMS